MLYSKRLICISTVIIMLVFILAIPVSAKVTNNSNISTSSLYEPVCLDEYSTMTWPSLSAAKAYYGYDYTYSPCSHYYNYSYYNYYYSFSDGGRLYFYVKYDDDCDPFATPVYESEMK